MTSCRMSGWSNTDIVRGALPHFLQAERHCSLLKARSNAFLNWIPVAGSFPPKTIRSRPTFLPLFNGPTYLQKGFLKSSFYHPKVAHGMVKSGIPIPSQCSIGCCSVCHLHLPRTRSCIPPDKLSPKISVPTSGLNFQSLYYPAPTRPFRHTTSGAGPLSPKYLICSHQNRSSRTSTATVGPSRSTSIIHNYFINRINSNYASSLLQNTHFATCISSLFSYLTTIVFFNSSLWFRPFRFYLISSYRFDHGLQT